MTDERPTIRPVTLSRLVELTHACENSGKTTEELKDELDVTERRARETILEANRIDLLRGLGDDNSGYATTEIGKEFLDAIQRKEWDRVSSILATRSPHYGEFLDVLDDVDQADLGDLLKLLEEKEEFTPYSFNQTGIEVVGDWAERLGRVQRNAFTGSYYSVDQSDIPDNFHFVLLSAYDDLEQTTGVDLRQRYLSIPRLRETVCERLKCRRADFDDALLAVSQQNVGKVELSGAPLDTAAKDSALGIKRMELADDEGLVTTSQSTQQVMAGVELYDKQYYYFAVHDRDITFDTEAYT
ncbi:hypothetical protein [Halorubrum sp. F4]|uniref:hypothetical protein n=1 Tax=Halorubrum sp. F4 TaxID=2989715 RepID=UPI0024801A12|nr:hypothetical protein [Halorubrum sp. F4]